MVLMVGIGHNFLKDRDQEGTRARSTRHNCLRSKRSAPLSVVIIAKPRPTNSQGPRKANQAGLFGFLASGLHVDRKRIVAPEDFEF